MGRVVDFVAGLGFAALLTATPAHAQPAERAAEAATISVTATGTVRAVPDEAALSAGVVTEAETAKAALDENNRRMAEVVAAFKDAGLADEDIRTTNVSLEPRYRYFEPRDGRQAPPQIVGYAASNQVTVRVGDLSRLGAILDLAVQIGANTLSGPHFGIEEPEPFEARARAQAVSKAREKAETLAEAAGVRLARVLTIEEGARCSPEPPPYARMAMQEAADTAVPIEPGRQTIEVQVNVVWEITQNAK